MGAKQTFFIGLISNIPNSVNSLSTLLSHNFVITLSFLSFYCQTFSKALVTFSDDGLTFSAQPLTVTPESKLDGDSNYVNLTLSLKTLNGTNVGKYIKVY